MDIATVSVLALVVVVAASCVTSANVGLMAMAVAWAIGGLLVPAGPQAITAKAVAGWFPAELFITLSGVTLLFSIARENGTLGLVTGGAERLCRSRPRALPAVFFLLATAVSAAGAGNVPTAALLASPAMHAASRLGLSPLIMMIMVGHGAIAGTLSPVSPMGVIADEKLSAMGLPGHEGYTFGVNLLVNAVVAIVGFSGYRLVRACRHVAAEGPANDRPADDATTAAPGRIDWRHAVTLALVAGVILGAVFFGFHIGLAAITAATLLLFCGAGDERAALSGMPWSVILMVCGMSVLVTLCEKTGGLDIFSRWIAACATPATLPAWLAGITGIVSVFSSTSGVVLPTFLPVVPEAIGHLGVEPTAERMLAAATAVNIGSNIVDVSSVSTIGALCVAAVQDEPTRRRLYRQGLAWGAAMTLVGAAACLVMP